MRINGASGFDAYGLAGQAKAPTDKTTKACSAALEADEVKITGRDEKYARQAMAVPEVNSAAVAEARALIAAGQLDTPEAIGRAANAILDLGV